MNRNRLCIRIANEELSFGKISKSYFILFLNPIIAFILVMSLVGIENGLAQNEPESLQLNQKKSVSQACDRLSHCGEGEIKEGNVCILEHHMYKQKDPETGNPRTSEYMNDFNQTYSCPPDSLVYFTKDINEILTGLDDVAERCVKIKRLYLSGHGVPGSLNNGLNKGNIGQLRDHSCLMADNPIVDLAGCNAGRGCSGKFFMQKAAEALFHNTEGTVIAPNVTTYIVEGSGIDEMNISRKLGENYAKVPFGYNALTYRPPPPEPLQTTWENLDNRTNYQDTVMAGLAESTPDEHATLREACVDTVESLIEDIREVENLYRSEGICKPLLECANSPYDAMLSQAEKAAKTLERSRPSNLGIHLKLSTNYHYGLKEIHERLLGCDYQCDRYRDRYRHRQRSRNRIRNRMRNRNRDTCAHERYSCVSRNNEGECAQKYTAGCDLKDYFLPRNITMFPARRSLRKLNHQGIE